MSSLCRKSVLIKLVSLAIPSRLSMLRQPDAKLQRLVEYGYIKIADCLRIPCALHISK